MKRFLTTLVALALGMTAFAQYGHVPRGGMGSGYRPGPGPGYGFFEDGAFELGVTLNHFTTRERDGFKAFRPDRVGFFGEYRVKLGFTVDMGIQLSTTFGKGSLIDSHNLDNPYGDDMRYWQGTPLVFGDINLLPYSGFNPYVGIGLGPGFGFEKNLLTGASDWTHAMVICPRAGVELFDHLRLSVQYQWYLNGSYTFSNVSFGISWAFRPGMGGGRRPMRR